MQQKFRKLVLCEKNWVSLQLIAKLYKWNLILLWGLWLYH